MHESVFIYGSKLVKENCYTFHDTSNNNFRFYLDEWEAVGCYLNNGPKALPTSFNNEVGRISGNDAMFEFCKAEAEKFGYQTFGVDDKSCRSGVKAEETYDDYGKSTKCSVSKSGNGSGRELNGDVFVYQLSE